MRHSHRLLFVVALLTVLGIGIWRATPFSFSHHTSARAHAMGTPITPITHAVFIMLENHTFDNFFGTYPCPSGDTECPTLRWTGPQEPDPFPSDFNHGSEAAYAAIDAGKMDGFEAHAYYQYKQSDIPIYWYYAQRYGLGDNFFTSYATSSTPNHIAMFAAQTGGIFETTTQTGCTSQANDLVHSISMSDASVHYWQPPCVDIPTLAPSLATAGLTWKYYCDVPIWCAPQMIKSLYQSPNNAKVENFPSDISNQSGKCTLANVSWITPTGIATDHPPSLLEPAQNFINDDVQAVMNSPCWNSTAIFITWDDWGGEYDHVVPPSIASQGPGLGPRVPLIVISPYPQAGFVSHQLGEFSSFVKFVENNFSLPNLGQRDSLSSISDLMDYFNFNQLPQPPPSDLPQDFPKLNLDMLHVPSGGLFKISGSLNPIIGGTSTKFTFSVVYTPSSSGITTTTFNVYIDGTPYQMTPGITVPGGNGIPGGTVYNYTTPLGTGTHTYYFSFADSTGSVILPHNWNNRAVEYIGPEVHSFTLNALTSPVKPSPALPGQPVTYTVTYTSPTNTPPTRTEVDIDGVAYKMTCTDSIPNYKKGAHYAYTTSPTSPLSPGVHYVIYRFDDGTGVAAYPGRITPIVTPVVLSHSSVSGSSGTFTFQTTYADAYTGTGNAPTQAFVYVDGAPPVTMSCVSHCTSYSYPGAVYQSQPIALSSGKHTYFFVFSDGQSSWGDPVGPQTYSLTVSATAHLISSGTVVGDLDDPS